MNSQHILHTDRLILKSVNPALIHDFYNTKSKAEIMDYFGFDEVDYEKFKLQHEKGIETYNISVLFFLLIDKQSNLPIGECGFHTWNKNHQRAELFYKIRSEENRRKGYAKEALNEVLNFGFTSMNLHRIEALVADWNTPSVKLVHYYGFTKEGTMREDYLVNDKYEDSDCYSLLKWEWNH
ncbi:GNAT family N-acetyltransferase [Paracrocinitomix mangrovi]|uniref:GNAT family N-acetyltransferase n=1 Tax=Paracrocinitomix mangrovi TaxID=2862509 RepID=UPI001C8DE25D|nr:GNAT family protein [Paracrocinitomix mangrovi]UKN00292.1 GNAT family N-acetyltransferase [Paracrocinitomix mangrovi]